MDLTAPYIGLETLMKVCLSLSLLASS